MQRSFDVIEIENQNLSCSNPNIDCINVWGNVRSFALRQVRDQILPDSELEYGMRQVRDRILPDSELEYGMRQVRDQILTDSELEYR